MSFNGRNGRTITVNRLQLIEKLKENLEIHKKDYAEAVLGYKVKLLEDLQRKVIEVQSLHESKVLDVRPVTFNPPKSYEEQYTDAITQLEWSVQDTIELDELNFAQFVQNKWSWSQGFELMNTTYKAALAGSSR